MIRIDRNVFGATAGARLTVILFVSIAAAGFAVFDTFDLPGSMPDLRETTSGDGVSLFGLSPRAILNIVFLAVPALFGLLLVLRKRDSAADRLVQDPRDRHGDAG